MNIKKLTLFRYCMRAFFLAIIIGGITGYNLFGTRIYTYIIVSALVGVISAVLISLVNFKQFIKPMKQALVFLEKLVLKSGVGSSEDTRTISGLERTFLLILHDLSQRLVIIAGKLTEISVNLSGCINQMIGGAAEVAGNIYQLTEKVEDISGRLKNVGSQAEEVFNTLQGSSNNLHLTGERIKVIAGQNETTMGIVEKFDNYSGDVSRALESISGIAQRINLLSLNASIEAAKAGEAERDFAVVAAEVRKLADQSAKVVREIGIIVEGVVQSSHLARESVREEYEIVGASAGNINNLEKEMDSILYRLEKFMETLGRIPESINGIAGSLHNISAFSQQADKKSREITEAMAVVGKRVDNLNVLSRKFKVEVPEGPAGGGKQMDVKNLKLNSYLINTALMAALYFGLLGFVEYFLDGAFVTTLFAATFSGIGGFYISSEKYRQIVGPLRGVMSQVEKVARQSGVESADDLYNVENIENSLMAIIADLILQLEAAGEDLLETIHNLKGFTEETMAGAEETATSTMEVALNAGDISKHLENVSEYVDNMIKALDREDNDIKEMGRLISEVAEHSKASVEIINQLNTQSEAIVKSLELVTGIAQRTNLLSLNAAVKAIKAGEAGRGFAVVAEEVGKLAEQSGKAAREIGATVNEIADCSRQAMSVINNEYEIVRDEKGKIDKLKEIMSESLTHVQFFFRQIGEIPSLIGQINVGIQGISAVAQEYSAATQEVNSVVYSLEEQINELKLLAGRFSMVKDNGGR
ncbi:MAG: methyl-accepting chemotaxis protein [Bacillota bacterium]